MERAGDLADSSDVAGSVVDDPYPSFPVDEDVVGLEILMEGVFPVKGSDSVDDLGHQVHDGPGSRVRVSFAPLAEGQSVDRFHEMIEKTPGMVTAHGPHQMGAVGPKADPLFESEAFEIGGVVAEVRRRGFHYQTPVVIKGVTDPVEAGGFRFREGAFDPEPVDDVPGMQIGRKGKCGKLPEDVVLVPVGQVPDIEDDAGTVVRAVGGGRANGTSAGLSVTRRGHQ